jgi:SAM-dependent methyltransferase
LEAPEQHFFEYNYPHRSRITAAGLEEPDLFEGCFPEIPYVQLQRGEPLPFEAGSFDIVFSNAVIEHVGTRDQQREFLQEILRVGRRAFVTTPNRWYPVDLHTVTPLLHWMPAGIYRRLYRVLGFDFFSREENLNLLDRRSLLRMVPESAQAQVHGHRFLGLTSNLLLWCKND